MTVQTGVWRRLSYSNRHVTHPVTQRYYIMQWMLPSQSCKWLVSVRTSQKTWPSRYFKHVNLGLSRGLCDKLITRPEESYRLWCVVVCELETSRMRRPWPALGRSTTKKKKKPWSDVTANHGNPTVTHPFTHTKRIIWARCTWAS